jgi:hypothetical protein
MRNTGDGKYVDVSSESGDGMKVKRSSRGAAFGDLDHDGRVDVVVLNSCAGPTVLRNKSPGAGHWLEVDLRGKRCNRFGVGSQVKVVAGDLTLVDEVHSGRSYQSHFGMRLHFGLGTHRRIDRLEVRWLGGKTDALADLAADQIVALKEGDSPPAVFKNLVPH